MTSLFLGLVLPLSLHMLSSTVLGFSAVSNAKEEAIFPNYLTPDDFERARLSELNGVKVLSNRSLEECTTISAESPSGEVEIPKRRIRSVPDEYDYETDNSFPLNKIRPSDIVKTPDEVQYEGKISAWKNKMWPNGRIAYTLNPNLSAALRAEVAIAMLDYHTKTCLRFEPKQPTDIDFVDIYMDNSVCGQADICRKGGRQYAKFGGNCKGADTMVHELGHTICLNHEHGRQDKAEYVQLASSRLECLMNTHGTVSGFHDWLTNDLFYDYLSVLHYAVLCRERCLLPKISGVTKCGSDRLSVLDVEKINALYECPGCRSYRFRPISKLFKTFSDNLSVNEYILWHTSFFGQGKGNEKENLVEGGRSESGEILYPCRAYHNGDIIPGRGNLLARSCQITYDGLAFEKLKSFEILTNPKNAGLKWRAKPEDGSLPTNAIPGGRTAEGKTLYIGRCSVGEPNGNGRMAIIPGKFYLIGSVLSNLYVAKDGKGHECSTYDILICE